LPFAARAQQPAMPVVGFLNSASADPYTPMIAAFRKSLSEAGYFEGQNVSGQYRWAEGQLERLPELAADLVRRQVSVIFTGGGSDPCLAAKAATSKIPIVFANGTDPVEAGLVTSLNRPGGNITGITFLNNTLGPKEVEVLHELMPKATVVAVLLNPRLSTAASQLNDVQAAARALGLQIHVRSRMAARGARAAGRPPAVRPCTPRCAEDQPPFRRRKRRRRTTARGTK
jgi:putative tryptophan/tyrosine transport system substrate-binding protein